MEPREESGLALVGLWCTSGVQRLVRDLNHFTGTNRVCTLISSSTKGLNGLIIPIENSVVAYQRQGDTKEELLIVICNFTPETRRHYRVGVPYRGQWKEVFNSDDLKYAGSGVLNEGTLLTSPVKYHGRDYSISLTLPPLGISILKLEKEVNEFELEDIGT
jgi:1,4-alpha-glucan branching enzyme